MDIWSYRKKVLLKKIFNKTYLQCFPIGPLALLSIQGQKDLGLPQTYFNLCSEDKRRSYGFGMTRGLKSCPNFKTTYEGFDYINHFWFCQVLFMTYYWLIQTVRNHFITCILISTKPSLLDEQGWLSVPMNDVVLLCHLSVFVFCQNAFQ